MDDYTTQLIDQRRLQWCYTVLNVAMALLTALPAGGGLTAEATRPLPVVPGLAGYGVETAAGRGGAILKVTTLAADGPGSLRAAIETKGARVIVFEVGGVVDLQESDLEINEPFVTIAGQTAPPPGITLIRGGVRVMTHDVLIQHIRVRPGDAGKPKRSGWSPDGLTLANRPGQPGAHRVVVDHCSFTWAVDENLSASGQRHEGRFGTAHQVTFAHCLIAEGLNDSTHAKGPHSMGTLIHDHARDILIVGNLYACNVTRNPVLKPGAGAVVVNNLIYNPGSKAIHSYWTPHEYAGQPEGPKPCELVAVGNVLWPGPDTLPQLPLIFIAQGKGRVFARDNQPNTIDGNPTLLEQPPFWPAGLKARPATEVAEWVLRNAGAFPGQRDAIDRRLIEQVRARTARIIDSQEQVGGYPKMEPIRRPLALPANPHGDDDGDGYTNLEEWLHRLAAAVEAGS